MRITRLTVVALGLIALAAPRLLAGYFADVPGHPELSWTFPISNGGFIGGMDTGPAVAGGPSVYFSESGSLYRLAGGIVSLVQQAANPAFASFVAHDLAAGRILYAESSAYNVWASSYDGSVLQSLGVIGGAYDAAVDASGRLFVTRAESFTGPTKVAFYDASAQQLTTVAEVSGPTGPLAFDAAGNLYFGTASAVFGEPGGQTIYRMSAAQLQGALASGVPVSLGSLDIVAANVDSVSDMLVLPGGDILFTSTIGSPGRIRRVSGGQVSDFAVLQSGFHYLTNLAWYEGSVFVNVGGVYGENWAPYGAIVQLVPEPSSLAVLAAGCPAFLTIVRRRRR